MVERTKYRVQPYNSLNWVVQEWIPARIAERGLYKGRQLEGKWKDLGYFSNPAQAFRRLLREELKSWESGMLEDFLAALEAAENRVHDLALEMALDQLEI